MFPLYYPLFFVLKTIFIKGKRQNQQPKSSLSLPQEKRLISTMDRTEIIMCQPFWILLCFVLIVISYPIEAQKTSGKYYYLFKSLWCDQPNWCVFNVQSILSQPNQLFNLLNKFVNIIMILLHFYVNMLIFSFILFGKRFIFFCSLNFS